jgi:hypothetical protein
MFRMTRDHSVVQQMLDAGMLTEEQAGDHPDSNRITRALGMAANVEVELRPGPFAVEAGDTFLLASDGLTDLVSDSEILSIYSNRSSEGIETAGRALVDMANLRGGHDNITVVLMRVRTSTQLRPLQGANDEAFSGPKTVVDADGHVTVVDRTPATMLSQGVTPAPEPRTTQHLPSETQPEEPRDTEPGPYSPPAGFAQEASQNRFVSDYPGGVPSSSRKGKLALLLAVLFTAIIVGAILLWWLVAAFSTPGSPIRWGSDSSLSIESGPRS